MAFLFECALMLYDVFNFLRNYSWRVFSVFAFRIFILFFIPVPYFPYEIGKPIENLLYIHVVDAIRFAFRNCFSFYCNKMDWHGPL